jgi:hypothetical protein
MRHATKKRLASILWPKCSRTIEAINRNADMMATIRVYEADAVEAFTERNQLYSAVSARLGNLVTQKPRISSYDWMRNRRQVTGYYLP